VQRSFRVVYREVRLTAPVRPVPLLPIGGRPSPALPTVADTASTANTTTGKRARRVQDAG